jgi:phosphoserine phosphatase
MVSFDIDGTLTLGHGWVLIADQFGRRPAYEHTTARFARGEIGEDTHLSNLLALAEGHTVGEVEAILEVTPKVKNIAMTVRELGRRGIRSTLLTHNPPYVCAWYARRYGFEAYEGCESPEPLDGVIGPPGTVHADKLRSLHRLLRETGVGPQAVVHVGDSRSDLDVFRAVGGGIALNSHITEVRSGADATVDSDDLSDVLLALDHLVPRSAGLRP